MSSPIPAAEGATGVPVTEAQKKAGEEIEERTPDAIKPKPEPEHEREKEIIPEPPDGDDALDTAGDMVKGLADRIATLEDAVKGLQKPDEPPVKRKPWTQRGGRKR